MRITSKQNPRYKEWKKLQTKKERKKQGLFLIEGEHLLEEVLKAAWPVKEWIISEEYVLSGNLQQHAEKWQHDLYTLPATLFSDLSETTTPQGIAAVVKIPEPVPVDSYVKSGKLLLLLDNIQDPGNLGTIIRTADAAGVDAILLGKGCADPFSGKVVRATQGSIFHVPCLEIDLETIVSPLKAERWLMIGTSLKGGTDYRQLKIKTQQKIALVMGNEGSGVQPALLASTDKNIYIPIYGQAESLNVGIATGILLYHLQGLQE